MREINLETTFKDAFFDHSHHIPDKTEKMDMRHTSFINMRNRTNLSKWLVFDYIKRLLLNLKQSRPNTDFKVHCLI